MEFRHSHSLGQNFLSDGNLLSAIAADARILPSDDVVEVGAGMGALTRKLAQCAHSVTAFEIDERLREYLDPLAAECGNVRVIYGDFMKSEIPVREYKAAANLPYYITTPVLFRFLDDPACRSVTVMVQLEVAERMIAPPGGKDYGALSVAVQLAGSATVTRRVGRHMFDPPPKVDSAVVHIEKTAAPVTDGVKRLVRAAFSMRRKTLVNCLASNGYDKAKVLDALKDMGLDPAVRGERISPRGFTELAERL